MIDFTLQKNKCIYYKKRATKNISVALDCIPKLKSPVTIYQSGSDTSPNLMGQPFPRRSIGKRAQCRTENYDD